MREQQEKGPEGGRLSAKLDPARLRAGSTSGGSCGFSGLFLCFTKSGVVCMVREGLWGRVVEYRSISMPFSQPL